MITKFDSKIINTLIDSKESLNKQINNYKNEIKLRGLDLSNLKNKVFCEISNDFLIEISLGRILNISSEAKSSYN